MFGDVSGELYYTEVALHNMGHQIVDMLHDNGYTTRQQVLDYLNIEQNLVNISNDIVFRHHVAGTPEMVQAPIVRFNEDIVNQDSLVARSPEVYDYVGNIAERYVYEDAFYIRTVSGHVFNATAALAQVQRDLPDGVISVLDELNIQ